jgi:glycine cleavage system H protein
MFRLLSSGIRRGTRVPVRNIVHYNKSHEWFDDDSGRFGITKYAAGKLGDVQFVNFSEIDLDSGQTYSVGEEICDIESVKAVEGIKMPFNGKISEINDKLEENPELVNDDPEGKGWLMVVEGKLEDGWMSEENYKAFVDQVD